MDGMKREDDEESTMAAQEVESIDRRTQPTVETDAINAQAEGLHQERRTLSAGDRER